MRMKKKRTVAPRVSLVTPSFNQGQFLEDAIRSVLGQNYPDLEYFVMDGGSTDGSLSIIGKYASHLSGWESVPDNGQAHAINKGWQKATGEYLWWLNSDDLLTEGSLNSAVGFLEMHPEVDLVYGDLIIIDEAGNRIGVRKGTAFDLSVFLTRSIRVPQPGALLRRKVLESTGLLNESLHHLMDFEFWLRLALMGCRFGYLPVPLAKFRVHSQSKTQKGSLDAVRERYWILSNLLESPTLPQTLQAQHRRIWSYAYADAARDLMKCGEYRIALGELLKSGEKYPVGLLRHEVFATGAVSLVGLLLGHKAAHSMRVIWRRIRRPWRSL